MEQERENGLGKTDAAVCKDLQILHSPSAPLRQGSDGSELKRRESFSTLGPFRFESQGPEESVFASW